MFTNHTDITLFCSKQIGRERIWSRHELRDVNFHGTDQLLVGDKEVKRAGVLGTKIGSGEVIYNAVYANRNYYLNAGRGKQGLAKGGLRGRFWFERMKADHLQDILKTAKEKAGGK